MHIVVHVLTDDPVYMRELYNDFVACIEDMDVPMVAFGPKWVDGLPQTNRGASLMMQLSPSFKRLTTTTEFLKEAILMAKTHFFTGTACSTVNDLVSGLVVSLNTGPREPDIPIGEWVTGQECTKAARESIANLANMVVTSTMNPEKMRVSLKQLDVLEGVPVEDVQGMDIVMWELAGEQPAPTSTGRSTTGTPGCRKRRKLSTSSTPKRCPGSHPCTSLVLW